MLKVATLMDKDTVVSMAMKFVGTTEMSEYADVKYIEQLAEELLTNGSFNPSVVIMHGDDGFLAGSILPFRFGPYLTASEIAWWVNPEKRNTRIGTELLEAFEYWAEKSGATFINMVSLDDEVGKYYEKKGYKLLERAYIKKI